MIGNKLKWDDVTRKAFNTACNYYEGRLDESSAPYILHAVAFAELWGSPENQALAMLNEALSMIGHPMTLCMRDKKGEEMATTNIIWNDLTRRAFEIACKAHAGQVDKGGVPYIFHPLHVAEQFGDPVAQAAALLHDVPENTSITADELRKEGIPEEVVHAVELLTHTKDDGLTYMEYIRRLKSYPVAADVKLADLIHNMDMTRIPGGAADQDISRNKRYLKAVNILLDEEAPQ